MAAKLYVCQSKHSCLPAGSDHVLQDIEELCVGAQCDILASSCVDHCFRGPNVEIHYSAKDGRARKVVEGVKTFRNIEDLVKNEAGVNLSKLQRQVGELKYQARRAKKPQGCISIVQRAFKALGGENVAISREPETSSHLLALRSRQQLALRNNAEAVADAQQAVKLGPRYTLAHVALGLALEAAGRWKECLQAWDVAASVGVGPHSKEMNDSERRCEAKLETQSKKDEEKRKQEELEKEKAEQEEKRKQEEARKQEEEREEKRKEFEKRKEELEKRREEVEKRKQERARSVQAESASKGVHTEQSQSKLVERENQNKGTHKTALLGTEAECKASPNQLVSTKPKEEAKKTGSQGGHNIDGLPNIGTLQTATTLISASTPKEEHCKNSSLQANDDAAEASGTSATHSQAPSHEEVYQFKSDLTVNIAPDLDGADGNASTTMHAPASGTIDPVQTMVDEGAAQSYLDAKSASLARDTSDQSTVSRPAKDIPASAENTQTRIQTIGVARYSYLRFSCCRQQDNIATDDANFEPQVSYVGGISNCAWIQIMRDVHFAHTSFAVHTRQTFLIRFC